MNRDQRRHPGKWPFNTETARKVAQAVDAVDEISEAERRRIVAELDEAAARKLFPMLDGQAILPVLHKARYESVYVSDEARNASRDWLQANGHQRMRGMPWPPKGELER